jgi:hypothetical protein
MRLHEKDTVDHSIPWMMLDARKSVEELHEEIKLIAKDTILACR